MSAISYRLVSLILLIGISPGAAGNEVATKVLCGIDVLVRDHFRELEGAKIGLITNQTGVDRSLMPTSLLLHQAENVELVTLFSPEHGIAGKLDQSNIDDVVDEVTGARVRSLYGKTRKPTAEMLSGIDTIVFDIQDIGTRFYTYIATMGEAMQAAEEHQLRFVVLDRPNPINGIDVAGPILDDGKQTFTGFHTLPLRHGMTIGELAQMFKAERFPDVNLQVIKCEGWQRDSYFDATGLYWINPSPNMRNLNQAILYPGVGVLEYTNISVGRGTDTPFEHFGAPWINAGKLASWLNGLGLPGAAFIPEKFTPSASKFENEPCEGVRILITDRAAIQPVKIGLAIASGLRRFHGEDWETKRVNELLGSDVVFKAIEAGESIEAIVSKSELGLDTFKQRRESFLIYE